MKIILLVFVSFIVVFSTIKAQVLQVTYQQCYTVPEYSYIYDFTKTENGYLVVSTRGLTTDTLRRTTAAYFVLSKIDTMGNILWQKSIGGVISINKLDIEPLPDGTYIIIGELRGSGGDFQSFTYGGVDIGLIKVNANGEIIWEKRYGCPDGLKVRDMEVLYDGSILASGVFKVPGGMISTGFGLMDIWVFRCDADGNLLWEKTFGDAYYNEQSLLRQTTDHCILLAVERSENSGNVMCDTTITFGYWLGKLDMNGNLMQSTCFHIPTATWMQDIIETADGYIVSGESYNYYTKNDLWFALLDKDLNFNGKKYIGGDRYENLSDIFRENDSTLLVFASSNSTSFITCNHSWDYDIWYIVMDNDCNIIGQSCFGGLGSEHGITLRLGNFHYITMAYTTSSNSGDVQCEAVANHGEKYWLFESRKCSLYQAQKPALPQGPSFVCTTISPQSHYYITSATLAQTYEWIIFPLEAGTLFFQDTTLTITWSSGFEGTTSILARSVNGCGKSAWSDPFYTDVHTCIGITEIAQSGIRLWPNPATDMLNVELSATVQLPLRLTLIDLTGRVLLSQEISQPHSVISLSSLPRGAYFCRLASKEINVTAKVIKGL